MNYEKIIIELMGRIQVLEEKVEYMMNNQSNSKPKEIKRVTTDDIRRYIADMKVSARASGEKVLVLRSGDLHKELGLKNAMPTVCNAMYQSMKDSDAILYTTPSGFSSTIEIEYKL